MRVIIGSILGIIVSLAIVAGVRLLALQVHVLPGMAVNDPEAMAAWLQGAPLLALALFVGAWFLGAFGGGWLAVRIARWSAAAWIVAVLDLLLAAVTMLSLTYPLWAKLALVAGPLLGGWLATRLRAAEPING